VEYIVVVAAPLDQSFGRATGKHLKTLKSFLGNIHISLSNFATLRLGGMNVRLRALLLTNHLRKPRKF
jgi:hypothetical protein